MKFKRINENSADIFKAMKIFERLEEYLNEINRYDPDIESPPYLSGSFNEYEAVMDKYRDGEYIRYNDIQDIIKKLKQELGINE